VVIRSGALPVSGIEKGNVLEGQRIVVPLLEDVLTLKEALGLEQSAVIGGIECRVLLPVLGPVQGRWPRRLAGPPAPGVDFEQDAGWPGGKHIWSEDFLWGGEAVVQAVGMIPAGTAISLGDEHIAFDHAAAQWRHLLRDWLAVAAEGPTDRPDRDYYGATIFGSSEYDGEHDGDDVPYQPLRSGHRYRPQRLSAQAWSHALGHAGAGDQPPLARTLMTSAIRAATTANWRVAIIDAATATEVALTRGLTARLSATLSSPDVEKKLDGTHSLGPRIQLARNLKMHLPDRISEDLKNPRNDVVHRDKPMTGDDVQVALSVAWEMVHEYDPLPDCCHEPGSPRDA
jgi:hypothetical protein